jgi:cation diffusion facilitator CzcD-associated flavoprotein CzcO
MGVRPRIGIIGGGFGGLAAAIELKRRGYDDIVIWEKADDFGGVWRDNTYPGAACDVPSPFYSFSFELNPRWPHRFSRQPAILDYVHHVADKYDVRRHVQFGAEVSGAQFDDESGQWRVSTSDGATTSVDVLVPAVGQLSRPSIPDIAGRDSFAGPAFHSARWRHDVDLTGKRVVVIGTGASAIQFVPEVQKVAAHVTVFQRTSPYIMRRMDREFGGFHQTLFKRIPASQLVERGTWYSVVESLSVAWVYARPLASAIRAMSKSHMRKQTKAKPGLFEKVWPDYPIGCKRVLFSNDYLPALAQPNVDLVTEHISEITPTGVRTTDGVEHEADVLIWGTGFTATEFLAPMQITGAGGRELTNEWKDGAHAYYGMTVPHFPNLVIMYGPNTNTGGGSVIYFLEAQAKYLADFVAKLADVGKPLAVREDVEQKYDDALQEDLSSSVWTQCSSWYRTASGRVTVNWPKLGVQYRHEAKFDPDDYDLVA